METNTNDKKLKKKKENQLKEYKKLLNKEK